MAASVIRGSLLLGKSMKCLRTTCRLPFSAPIRRLRYYVALPVTPNDTPDNNPLLRIEDDPHLSRISPKQMVRGCAKLSLDFERIVDAHFSSFIDDPNKPRTFESVVAPVDALHAPLRTAASTVTILTWFRNSQPFIDAKARIDPQVERALADIYTDECCTILKDLYTKSKDSMTDEEISLLELMLRYCQKSGLDLNAKSREDWDIAMRKLHELSTDFGKRATACKRLFVHTITDPDIIKHLPMVLLYYTSVNTRNPGSGPWKFTLNDSVYKLFLEYCPDAEERHNIWYAYNNVSSTDYVTQYLDTHRLIDEIVRFRKQVAEDFGYASYAQYMMQHKMAGSVDTVLNMVEELRNAYLPQAEEEFDSLQEFAEEDGYEDELKLCDVPYYRRKQKESLHKEENVSSYFMYKDVVESAMHLATHMFGIKFVYSDRHYTFSEDALGFDAFDEEGKVLGHYILDPFPQPEKLQGTWMLSGRARCKNPVLTPYTYQSMDLDRNNPTLTWHQLGSFYLEFGFFLQQCLSKTSFHMLSTNGTEEDIDTLLGHLLLQFTMDPEYLQKISRHIKTGEKLPMPVIQAMLQENKHMAGWDLCYKLFKIAYDMEINLSHDNWYSTLEKIWPLYMPIPLDIDDNHPCSDLNQFQHGLAASSYHVIWTEMVALDMLEVFRDAGSLTDEKALQEVGYRLRDSFFQPLATVKAKELFRRFRGRDPSVEPLKSYYKAIN
ncbi:uncharacterized protein LOC132553439 [Ylistrum balloti]|uniref:uncharacterized protein LOC132553439 n=1 Tax=Ylistrum balloti TaxID=509963 RepID=UPI002905A728|nr:uncharacterized protein LOC132553439 [Ylistrum balloti]